MKDEYIELLKKVEETDAYFSANLDLKDPSSLYGKEAGDAKRAALDTYRKELTKLLAKVKSPKDADESLTRKRTLVQIQFMWLLADVMLRQEARPGEHPEFFADPLLRYKCVCLSLKEGGPVSTCIDFETMAWIRTIDTSRLREVLKNGSFKGKLAPDKDSPYYGMQNSETGAQIMTDFCIGDLNPKIAAKMYAGNNASKFVHQRMYGMAVVKRLVQTTAAAENYSFLHILDEEEDTAFRIRFVNAFKGTLHMIYAQGCMRDYSTDDLGAVLSYAALKEHGMLEIMKAYKTMYDPDSERTDYLYQDENPEEREYRERFLQIYSDIRGTLTGDRAITAFQRKLLTAAGQDARPERALRLADTCMKLDRKMQRSLIESSGGDPAAALKLLESYGKKGENFETYRYRMGLDIGAFMSTRKKVTAGLNDKLARSSEAVRDRYQEDVDEILYNPDMMLKTAYENDF